MIAIIMMTMSGPHKWSCGRVFDLRSWGHGFRSHAQPLCTNANSACHPPIDWFIDWAWFYVCTNTI